MWKLTAIVALSCAIAAEECSALETPQLSRRLTVTMPKSTTVPMGDQLYTVSMGKSSLHVNSSDANHKPCDMAIDPAKDSIDGEMGVATSGERMYIWGEHSVERVDGKARTKYALLMVNPRDCSLKSADIPDVNVGMKPSLPRLLVNDASVDFYFPSLRTCAPCRFNHQGMKAKNAPPQIAPPEASSDGRIYWFDIRKVGPNYLYAQNTEGKKATLKRLDAKSMNVVKEKQVDYPVDAMANTKAGLMGVCSKNHDRRMADIVAYKEINCERINANLDATAKMTIPIGPHSRPVSRVSYDILDSGDKTYIGFAESQELRVYVYDLAGELLKSYDLGKIDERFQKYEGRPMQYMPYSHWNVRGFVVGKEYCLVTEQVSDRDKHEVDLHDVRCIDI